MLPTTNQVGEDPIAIKKAPSPAANPENRITWRFPIFSTAHVAGQSVMSVIIPVMVKTMPISPGPQPKELFAYKGTKVARVPARVHKYCARD